MRRGTERVRGTEWRTSEEEQEWMLNNGAHGTEGDLLWSLDSVEPEELLRSLDIVGQEEKL